MKNTLFLSVAALVFSASVNAQSTVDSINAKYQLLPMPEALTIEKTFPVLGTYQVASEAASTTAAPIVITLDQENKGVVWIEGLPQGKMKAYMKKAPSTYRILAQKTDSGKQIPEGTLIFDASTNTLNIALGKPFDNTDPSSVFNIAGASDVSATGSTQVKVKSKNGSSKTKQKLMFYTATKADQTVTSSSSSAAPAPGTQQ